MVVKGNDPHCQQYVHQQKQSLPLHKPVVSRYQRIPVGGTGNQYHADTAQEQNSPY